MGFILNILYIYSSLRFELICFYFWVMYIMRNTRINSGYSQERWILLKHFSLKCTVKTYLLNLVNLLSLQFHNIDWLAYGSRSHNYTETLLITLL